MEKTFTNISEDKPLVSKVLSGDQPAFGLIVKKSERIVGRILVSMIRRAEDRKDIAQDIYMKAYMNLRLFRFQSKLTTWIAQIAYNTCIDYLRKKKSMPVIEEIVHDGSADNENDRNSADFIAAFALPDEQIARKKLADLLKAEIEKLDPLYQTLVSLYHNEELTYDEIAALTGMPTGTVKNYVFRARRKMKNNILSKYKKEDL